VRAAFAFALARPGGSARRRRKDSFVEGSARMRTSGSERREASGSSPRSLPVWRVRAFSPSLASKDLFPYGSPPPHPTAGLANANANAKSEIVDATASERLRYRVSRFSHARLRASPSLRLLRRLRSPSPPRPPRQATNDLHSTFIRARAVERASERARERAENPSSRGWPVR